MTNLREYLDKSRLVGDAEADQLVSDVFQSKKQSEIYALLSLNESEIITQQPSGVIGRFLLTPRQTPSWFDERKIIRGQKFFTHYADEIMTLLGVMALPYCYASSPGNKALYLSEKMRNSQGKRLLDTAHFTICVSSLQSHANGIGTVSINKTRLIHAIARYYISKGEWNMQWGVPINQEDMAGTNLAFSLVILMGLQQSGLNISDQEKEDFLFMWRYIGYQLHIDEQLLPNSFKEAFYLAQLIKKRTFCKSHESVMLTRELLNYYRSMIPANQAAFVESQIKYFVGDGVADYLGLQTNALHDQFAGLMNTTQQFRNFLSVHTGSYGSMMQKHATLKRQVL